MAKVKGYSKNSLEEALEDAINAAPKDPRAEGTADYLFNYTVSSSGKEIGGIADLNRFFVEINLDY